MSFDSDAEIVQAVLSGDKQAFGLLINRYWGMVYQLAYQRLAEPMLAEDRAQEAFLQAFLSLEHLQKPAQFRAWLYGITLNLCNNFSRKQGRFDLYTHFADDWQDSFVISELSAEAMEMSFSLEAAIAQLSPANQEAIILYYYDNLSLSEVAERLQISPTAVKGRLHKSRQALKGQLESLFPSHKPAKGAKKMIPVQVVDVPQQVNSNETGTSHRFSQVLLYNEESRRALVLWIWEEDIALSIAQMLAAYTPQRPRQHDFAAKLIEATGASLESVLLNHLSEGIPYASLTLKTKLGETVVDARPGEAIALALHLKAPLFVSEKMWENASAPLPAGREPNRKGVQAVVEGLDKLRESRQLWANRNDWLEMRTKLNKSIREQAREIIDSAFS
jgi:RNA polymerase sigma factor (sigma-70 family)